MTGTARRQRTPWIIMSERSRPLMLVMLVTCALTVSFTRLFLVLTGYPQIGGSTYHIAHALWGGLALLIAGIVSLVVANRGAAFVVAFLTGLGFGLFVDEVGKFITQKNDYFFPLAAPIVYASLMLILAVTELAGRRQLRDPHAHVVAALSLSQTLADGTVTHTELRALGEHLEKARQGDLDDATLALLDGIERAVAQADHVDDSRTLGARLRRGLLEFEESLLPAERARKLARFALLVIAVNGLIQVVLLVAVAVVPGGLSDGMETVVDDYDLGSAGTVIQVTTVALGGAVALLAGIAWWSMRPGTEVRRRALRSGYAALLTLLLVGNLLSSLLDQFAVLVSAALQVVALGLLARWDRATRTEPERAATP